MLIWVLFLNPHIGDFLFNFMLPKIIVLQDKNKLYIYKKKKKAYEKGYPKNYFTTNKIIQNRIPRKHSKSILIPKGYHES